MKNIVLTTLMLFCISLSLRAEEGMWLPSLIGKTKLADMQKKGLKLTAEDLYSINNPSLKDAVVFLQGCTGEMISKEGLLLTNHHCGYGAIQQHSTVEKDYLTDGFWAMNRGEELPVPGYTASYLIEMRDVSTEVEKGVKESFDETKKNKVRNKNIKKIISKVTKKNGYNARVESMYYTNQYFLYIFETFTDVRLVGAPPSAIGKFGGDTDNWMWPRHTGDFCLFRVYSSKENKPSVYSKENVPYVPKRSLVISTEGVEKGDFTFIYGYPGRTSEYLVSDAVDYIAETSNPHKIKLRTMRLDVMNSYQSKDVGIRIKYAAKNARVANAWKKWIGEASGIKKLNVIDKKESLEAQFIAWAEDKPQYKGVVEGLKELYAEVEPLNFAFDYYVEAFKAIEIVNFAAAIQNEAKKGKDITKTVRKFYKNYHTPIDQEIAVKMIAEMTAQVDKKFRPVDIDAYKMFNNTILTDSTELIALSVDPKKLLEVLNSDYTVGIINQFGDFYNKNVIKPRTKINLEINARYKSYMKGLMEMQPQKMFYPDANSTLRIAYGNVDGFNPRDGVEYDHVSTLEGIIEKDNPEIYDYDVPDRLKELHAAKDFGRWEVDGTVPVAFIATNHTTGGNSGSPILNAKGELIGLNFDRCWESTMSDIIYDKDLCRNISVDVRYILFIIDKYAGAHHLIEELELK